MPRPKTLGPIVPVRLPLDLHDEMVRRAASVGRSPALFLREVVEMALNPTEMVKNGCDHKRRSFHVNGTATCRDCGAQLAWSA